MKTSILRVLVGVILFYGKVAASQTPKASLVPNLVRFSGTATASNGKALNRSVGITFALYQNQDGGSPLWLETQKVAPDRYGRYTISLGVNKAQGVPLDLFSSRQAQWLGVQIEGQPEQPRVLLLSVPYALKAVDAGTIGGLSPSAFVFVAPTRTAAGASADSKSNSTNAVPPASVTGTGTANFVPLWTSASNLANSALLQSGAGSSAKIGLNTTAPGDTLDIKGTANVQGLLTSAASGVATAASGKSSQGHHFIASSFNSGTGTGVNQTFQWKAEAAGNNTASPSGTLIANNRMLIFGGNASTQTRFPQHNDAWVLGNANGHKGTPTWSQIVASGIKPGAPASPVGAYDSSNNRQIIYAGGSWDGDFFGTWILTGANGL